MGGYMKLLSRRSDGSKNDSHQTDFCTPKMPGGTLQKMPFLWKWGGGVSKFLHLNLSKCEVDLVCIILFLLKKFTLLHGQTIRPNLFDYKQSLNDKLSKFSEMCATCDLIFFKGSHAIKRGALNWEGVLHLFKGLYTSHKRGQERYLRGRFMTEIVLQGLLISMLKCQWWKSQISFQRSISCNPSAHQRHR